MDSFYIKKHFFWFFRGIAISGIRTLRIITGIDPAGTGGGKQKETIYTSPITLEHNATPEGNIS
jgi:hypothetical protein